MAATLAARASDAACDLFPWRQGVFYLEGDLPPDEEVAVAPLDVFALVMEGTRWIDEHGRIRRLLPSERAVLRRGPAWPLADLDLQG